MLRGDHIGRVYHLDAATLSYVAQSRTPTVAALYRARLRGIGIAEALAEVCSVLPTADPIRQFREAIQRIQPVPPANL